MPKEVLRINSGLRWKTAIITATTTGLQTELLFDADSRPLSLIFDSVPDKIFFSSLMHLRCLGVYSVSSEERGWIETGRFRICISDDDDDLDDATLIADEVDWHIPNVA